MTSHGTEYNAVYELLVQKGLSPRPQGQDFLIKCLSPDHEDSDPSMRIDQTTGIGHCFSCGFKLNIFKFFGILTNPVSVQIAKLKKKMAELIEQSEGLSMPEDYELFNYQFRGISTRTYKHFGAFVSSSLMEDRVIFPITDVTHKIRAFIGRHTLSNANPRYLVSPANAKMSVFPAYLETRTKYIVLVEGMFDMLNTWDKGLKSVVCAFGSQALKADTKSKLLPFKAQGVTHVFILFDGDDAGRLGALEITPLIEELGFTVETVALEEGTDPGDLSEEDIHSLKEYFDGKCTNSNN